jgi:hypothetical protein
MNGGLSSLNAIRAVARALGPIVGDVAFVGGSAMSLYVDDVAVADVRVTDDVDCVVEVHTLQHMHDFEAKLRSRGFTNHPNSPVICRWLLGDIPVDMMPTSANTLGFSNPWYTAGMANRCPSILSGGETIFIFEFPYYFASKLQAFVNRGYRDWLTSKDLEDLVTLLDGRREAQMQLANSSSKVRSFIARTCTLLVERPDSLLEAITAHMRPNDHSRVPYIWKTLQYLSSIDAHIKYQVD